MRKIIVLGISKNIANQVSILNDCLQSVLNLHHESHAYIYENDSTDGTPEKLIDMARKDPRITVVCEKSENNAQTIAMTWDNKPCRIECISNARNKCMELWEKSDPGDEESVVLWMDTDRVSRLDHEPIEFLAKQLSDCPPDTIKGFFAFSKNHRGEMYDRYAYRDEKFPLGPELMGETWWKSEYQNKLLQHIHSNTSPHSQVLSACNGLAMYKSEAIRGKRFSAYPTPQMEKYYRTLYRNEKHPAYELIHKVQEKPTTHQEGVLLGRYVFGTEGMWYHNNSGYNQPVVCEWVPFNFAVHDGTGQGLFLIHGWVDISGH